MTDTDDRLRNVEARLGRIEQELRLRGARDEERAQPRAVAPSTASISRQSAARPKGVSFNATQLMGWAASIAFILAAGYFVKLVYDAGWLTPERQIGFALLLGAALVVGGVLLARLDREYAVFMPAVGVVVLYLGIYAGHLFYGLFRLPIAVAGVGTVAFAALWLSRRFNNSTFSLLAVAGTYLMPLFVRAVFVDLVNLVVYFTAWGLMFSFISVHERQRITYLAALYFALLGFDIAYRMTDESAWALAAGYQFAQFSIFACTAMLFSVRHRQPMRELDAVLHGFALFYFYAIEYILLRQHLPFWAPIIALASVAVVLGLFFFARSRFEDVSQLRASAALVSTYAAVVTSHVVFFEFLPDPWVPWAACFLPLGVGVVHLRYPIARPVFIPVAGIAVLLFVMGYARALAPEAIGGYMPLPDVLLFVYAGSLYAAYLVFRRRAETFLVAPVTLYAAHAAFLTVTIRLLESELWISVAWGLFAVILLGYAVRREDKMVGQSSLIIFAASGLKVLLFDLAGAAPLVRVLTLAVLATSLYAGGWLYQKMSKGDVRFHPDGGINDQLNVIRRLCEDGVDDAGIVDELERRAIVCLSPEGTWSAELVGRIRRDYGMDSA